MRTADEYNLDRWLDSQKGIQYPLNPLYTEELIGKHRMKDVVSAFSLLKDRNPHSVITFKDGSSIEFSGSRLYAIQKDGWTQHYDDSRLDRPTALAKYMLDVNGNPTYYVYYYLHDAWVC